MKAPAILVLTLFLSAPTFLPETNHSLPRSTPESQGIASADILAFIEAADKEIDTMNSFMLVRGGHVVAEGWWTPYDAESRHILYSLTKSFTSTAVGMAIAEGKFNLHDPVVSFFPDEVPADPSNNLQAMRVHDLIRMATGHREEANLFGSEDPWTKTFLSHPVEFRPGTHFLYNTPATHMLSAIIQKTTGMTTEDYLQPRLFEPLGIEDPLWLKSPEGASIGGFGLSVRTEDIAKFGQMYLQKGLWKGKQLVPAEWVDAATSLQVANGSDPNSDWAQGYGYQFWRTRNNTYRGDGAFGQYCIVMPEHDAVLAITSGVGDMQAVLDLIFEKLYPALRAAPLPENEEAHEMLLNRLANLSVKTQAGNPDSPLANEVSGKRYAFPANDQEIEAVTLEFERGEGVLTFESSNGKIHTPVGSGSWLKSNSPFAFGLDGSVGLSTEHPVAASGAWKDENTFAVKICLFETPFYTTLTFRFDDDSVHLSSETNVAFGSRQGLSLTGQNSG